MPTRASILTGQAPARLHITAVFDRDGGKRMLLPPNWTNLLPLPATTLPERLKELGYTTGHVGKWHLGPPEEYWPEHHGFDVNRGGWREGDTKSFFSPYNNPRLPDGPPGEYLTDRLTTEAVAFLEANAARPFFLYLAHLAPHAPIQAPEEEILRATGRPGVINPAYAGMIRRLDTGIGRVLETLDRLKLADRTLVLFTSDNGGVHHTAGGAAVTTNAPWRGEKATLYEGGIRVPLIVRWPGRAKPGTVTDVPATSADFLPTLAAAAGARGHGPEIDGLDLTPLLTGGPPPPRDFLAWHYPHYFRDPIGTKPCGAIRSGHLKLLEDFETGSVELYDLRADPGESRNLSGQRQEDAARLLARLRDWRRRVGAQMPRPNPAFPPAP